MGEFAAVGFVLWRIWNSRLTRAQRIGVLLTQAILFSSEDTRR